jgi:hypothetical protein
MKKYWLGGNMEAYKEELITRNLPFPVDIFISDNSIKSIGASPHWER